MWSRFVMSQVKHNSYFLCGVALGLWVSLAAIPLDDEAGCAGLAEPPATAAAGGAPDEYEPAREQRPLGAAGAPPAGRSVQRPRYYSTELGMRGSLLCGILSSEDALKSQVAALNQTMGRLQPALKFFITASAMSAVPGLANVVGFTDTREMLKPFHALKYLADNYLEEYDFFFLALDGGYVNARRLARLARRLSVSRDVYMGAAAPDSHYCSLDSGVLLSNSVLRAVHGELDWCVRNSYSAHHHENLGRCVLHAAHLACQPRLQGESFVSVRLAEGAGAAGALSAALADAVSVLPAPPPLVHALHAYISRVQLERVNADVRRLRAALAPLAAAAGAGAGAGGAGAGAGGAGCRRLAWPAGMRGEPTAAPAPPDNRFEHLRWTAFNASHAHMPDEHRALAELRGAHAEAAALAVDSACAWARRRWPWAAEVALLEGAWQWEPAAALRHRLLLALAAPGGGRVLRAVEVARPLGAARLVPVRYVTESARVRLVLAVPPGAAPAALAALRRRRAPPNTQLHVVVFPPADGNSTESEALAALRAEVAARGGELTAGPALAAARLALAEGELYSRLARAAARALRPRPPPDALLLFITPDLEFDQDFLNRVRMSAVAGASWWAPLPFRRHALAARPARRALRTHTGRFNDRVCDVLAVHVADLDAAEAAWQGDEQASLCAVLAHGALAALRAPEPAAALAPRPRPAPAARRPLRALQLGQRNSLAQLLLEHQL